MGPSKLNRPAATPRTFSWRHAILLILVFGSLFWMLTLEPIAQNRAYHSVSNTRKMIGIPNFFDVVSNLPFLIIGILGLRFCMRGNPGTVRSAWTILFVGVEQELLSGHSVKHLLAAASCYSILLMLQRREVLRS